MPLKGKQILHARAFVDWHSVQSRVFPDFNKHPRKQIAGAVLRIQQRVAGLLDKLAAGNPVRAGLRFYHGWHKGREPLPVRRDFERFSFEHTFARRIKNVSFLPGFEFGNQLSCYDAPMPLFDTLRSGGQPEGQKMVDTAIACDLLHYTRTFPNFLGVVLAEDDDFLPPVITCMKWGGVCALLRVEERDTSNITDENLENAIYYWGSP